MIPIAHAEVRVEVVNLYDEDEDDYDDDDVDQHPGAFVGELGPLHCPQTPLVLIIIATIILMIITANLFLQEPTAHMHAYNFVGCSLNRHRQVVSDTRDATSAPVHEVLPHSTPRR